MRRNPHPPGVHCSNWTGPEFCFTLLAKSKPWFFSVAWDAVPLGFPKLILKKKRVDIQQREDRRRTTIPQPPERKPQSHIINHSEKEEDSDTDEGAR